MNIFVGSLPFKIEEADLKELFEAFGEVSSVKIINDRESGRSKGFGFIEMPDDDAAKKAIADLNGSDVGGRNIVVTRLKTKNLTIAEAALAAAVVAVAEVTLAAAVVVIQKITIVVLNINCTFI